MQSLIETFVISLLFYIILNFIAFLSFGYDKLKAKVHTRRTSEKTLLGISALGPFGAFAGMSFFRHKTRKEPFTIAIPLFMIIHLILIAALLALLGFDVVI